MLTFTTDRLPAYAGQDRIRASAMDAYYSTTTGNVGTGTISPSTSITLSEVSGYE